MDRRDVLLILIGAGNEYIAGITRLQKYLFLVEQEHGVNPSGDGTDFEPYRFGPYDPNVYDDIQYLQNIGFLEPEDEGAKPQAETIEEMDFDFLAPSDKAPPVPSDEELVEREGFYAGSYEGEDAAAKAAEGDLGPDRVFRLTDRARDYWSCPVSVDT